MSFNEKLQSLLKTDPRFVDQDGDLLKSEVIDKAWKIDRQLFIEPKGKYLQERDKWKEEFLKELKERFKDKLLTFNERDRYRIIGIPFYNNADENEFKKSLFEAVGISK